jgi:hypothetical protein
MVSLKKIRVTSKTIPAALIYCTHAEPIGERRIPTKKGPPYVFLKDEERQHDRMQPKSTEHGMSTSGMEMYEDEKKQRCQDV